MPSTRSTAELIELLNSNSRAVAYDLVDPIASFLTSARDTFDGDLDRGLIMLVISLRSSRHPSFRRLDDADLATRKVMPGYGINVRSIADSTGIPRESVRRKVQQLIDAGWVARDGRTLCYTVEGYNAAQGMRECIMRMYARGYQVVGALDVAESKADGSKIDA